MGECFEKDKKEVSDISFFTLLSLKSSTLDDMVSLLKGKIEHTGVPLSII